MRFIKGILKLIGILLLIVILASLVGVTLHLTGVVDMQPILDELVKNGALILNYATSIGIGGGVIIALRIMFMIYREDTAKKISLIESQMIKMIETTMNLIDITNSNIDQTKNVSDLMNLITEYESIVAKKLAKSNVSNQETKNAIKDWQSKLDQLVLNKIDSKHLVEIREVEKMVEVERLVEKVGDGRV